jgi:hypothetical protein
MSKKQNNTEPLQPRTRREQELVDAIVDRHTPASELDPRTPREHRIVAETERNAEKIRAARQDMHDRIALISPFYSAEQKAEARARINQRSVTNYTITAKWRVAGDYKQNDVVQVRTDVKPTGGDLVALRWIATGEITVSYLHFTNGKVWRYKLKDWPKIDNHRRAKAGDIEILGVVVSPKPEPAKGEGAAPKSDEKHLDSLRAQLRSLEEEGEAHNESGIFRLERMIYDLERQTDSDEWPEVIGDE